jgi:hypothetical protein
MVRLAMGRFDIGTQLHAPLVSTAVVQTAVPFAVSVTDWPGTPVPVNVGRTTVVDALPPSGGYVSATAATTHADVAVLYA